MAAASRPPNFDVVVERLDNLKAAVEDLHADTTRRFDALGSTYVSKEVYAADEVSRIERATTLSARIGRIEQGQTWLWRAIGSAVFVGLAGVVADRVVNK